MSNVPFLDLKEPYLELRKEIDAAVARVLESGWYILGPEVEAFESEYSAYCKVKHTVGVASGLDALILSLEALGIGSGDEVIVPSNTFIATWLAVAAVGAKPIPVEPCVDTYNINSNLIEAAVSEKTKAIIPVHLYGVPCDLDPVISIAKRYNIAVIEDAAQAHGAKYRNTRIGGTGDLVCWSFYPGKNLGAMGDGGAITTNSTDLAQQLRVLRNYGSKVKYLNERKGRNSRLDPIQAAILRVKLKYLDDWNARRCSVATFYLSALKNTGLILPQVCDWADPVWHLFVVRCVQRDAMKSYLENSGVSTLIHYPIPPHRQAAFLHEGYDEADYPICTLLSNQILSLPMGPHLKAPNAERVVDAIMKFHDEIADY